MNLYFSLFLTFLKIGAFSFGGGYGMIAVIRESCLSKGWLTEGELMNFIAVAESTPGPIAVNMATFVGSSQGGFLGALVATLGVVLPSFAIILLIAAVMKSLLKFPGVQGALNGVKPVVVGLITATGLTMTLSVLLGLETLGTPLVPDGSAVLIFGILAVLGLLWKKFRKKSPSPLVLILLSAVLGMVLYP